MDDPLDVRRTVVVIVGPTAAGKTELSLRLAPALDGEIISADSRQIYRGMDIGTAKPTPTERAAVPHHLLDVVDPDRMLTLAEYQRMAYECIAEIQARGRLPFLVGGTGQYVRAVVEGWVIPAVAPDMALRGRLEEQARAEGAEALHRRLASLDPLAAARALTAATCAASFARWRYAWSQAVPSPSSSARARHHTDLRRSG